MPGFDACHRFIICRKEPTLSFWLHSHHVVPEIQMSASGHFCHRAVVCTRTPSLQYNYFTSSAAVTHDSRSPLNTRMTCPQCAEGQINTTQTRCSRWKSTRTAGVQAQIHVFYERVHTSTHAHARDEQLRTAGVRSSPRPALDWSARRYHHKNPIVTNAHRLRWYHAAPRTSRATVVASATSTSLAHTSADCHGNGTTAPQSSLMPTS